jgi:sugar/nucleoside kinase (ribokinase family)
VGFSELAWRRRLEEFLELASVIKVSQADLDFFYSGNDPEEMLRAWSHEKLVFLTLVAWEPKFFTGTGSFLPLLPGLKWRALWVPATLL